ncbi:hypothetical protein DFH06DRAFT_1482325 [Mycena polygramma]|nr:hypothetical protein DFH06DRAFT_1482325 [Mycena polygramma]
MLKAPIPPAGQELPASFTKWLVYNNSEERKAAAAAAATLAQPPPPKIDYEMPLPIPEALRRNDCVYGHVLTDAFIQTYFDAHPSNDTETPRPALLRRVMFDVSRRLGIYVYCESLEEEVVYFSSTLYGKARKKVPTTEHLKKFADAMGFTEPARWIDTTVTF